LPEPDRAATVWWVERGAAASRRGRRLISAMQLSWRGTRVKGKGPVLVRIMPRRLATIAVCSLAYAAAATAQAEGPREVAEHIWAAVQNHDWALAAHYTHPRALHEFRALLDPVVSVPGAAGDSAREAIFGTASSTAAAAASDSAVYVNLMRWSSSIKAEQPGAVEASHYDFLGTVSEGKDTIHVIARASATVGGRFLTWIQVYSLSRSGSAWRGLIEPNWSQFAAALRAAVTDQK
jgi:hypothetical protein